MFWSFECYFPPETDYGVFAVRVPCLWKKDHDELFRCRRGGRGGFGRQEWPGVGWVSPDGRNLRVAIRLSAAGEHRKQHA